MRILGLDELWVGDEGPARDPFAVLAAAAAVTGRIQLATGVTNPYMRHPGAAAASMLTIHELSGGRAVLGVGAGGQMSLAPFGLRASRPLERVREFLDIARAVATGTPAAGYSPSDVAVTQAAADAASGRGLDLDLGPVPILIAGRGDQMLRTAGAVADRVLLWAIPASDLERSASIAAVARELGVSSVAVPGFDPATVGDHVGWAASVEAQLT